MVIIMLRTINKAEWKKATEAGETTLTYAAWRAEQKALADTNGESITTFDATAVAETAPETVTKGAVIEGAVIDEPSTEAVLNVVDTAIADVNIAQAIAANVSSTSKSKMAQTIFAAALAKQQETGVAMVRKDVIGLFMLPADKGGAGLSKHGANTYYQNIRAKHGLVTHKS